MGWRMLDSICTRSDVGRRAHLCGAAQLGAGDQHLRKRRVQRELHHFAAQLSQPTCDDRVPW